MYGGDILPLESPRDKIKPVGNVTHQGLPKIESLNLDDVGL